MRVLVDGVKERHARGVEKRHEDSLARRPRLQVTALLQMGKLDRALDVLTLGVERGGPHVEELKKQLLAVRELEAQLAKGRAELERGSFSAARPAKTLFVWRLGLCGAHS